MCHDFLRGPQLRTQVGVKRQEDILLVGLGCQEAAEITRAVGERRRNACHMDSAKLGEVQPFNIGGGQRRGGAASTEVVDSRITHRRGALQHEARAQRVVVEDVIGGDALSLHLLDDALAEGVGAKFGEIGSAVPQARETDCDVELRAAGGYGVLVHILESAFRLGDEEAHGLTHEQDALFAFHVPLFLSVAAPGCHNPSLAFSRARP